MAPISDSEKKIKDMLEGMDVPFNPADWEKASAMLDQQAGGRKRRGLLLWLLSALALVGAATTVVLLTNEKEKEKPVAQDTTNNTTPATDNSAETPDAQNEENTQHTDIILPGTNEETTDANEEAGRQSNFPLSRPEMRQKTGKGQGNSNAKPATTKQGGERNNTGGNNNNMTQGRSGNPPKAEKETPKADKGNSENQDNQPVSNPPEAEKVAGADTNSIKSVITGKNPGKEDKIDTAGKLLAKSDTTSALDTLEKKPDETKPTKRLKMAPETLLGIYAGVNYTRNIQSTAVAADYSTSFTGGLFFRNTIKGRLGFGLGLGYSSFNTGGLSKTFVSKNYSFGRLQDSTAISPQKIQVMDIMALLYYGIPKTGNLVVGVNMSLLLAANSQLSNTQESTLNGSTNSKRNESGYMNGFNNSALLNIGYERQWKDRWRYGVMMQTGLGSFVNSSYYNNVSTYNNFRIQFYLGYGIKFR